MKKKILFVLLILLSINLNVKAANIYKPTSPSTATPGSDIDVIFTLTKDSSDSFSGIDGDIHFDSNVLTFKSITSLLSSKWTLFGNNLVDGSKVGLVNMTFDDLIANSSTDVLKVTFTVNSNATGSTTVSIANPMGTNASMDSVTVQGGSLNIAISNSTPQLSDDNTLKSLKVDGVSVDYFNPNTTSYSMTVPNSKSSVEITAELNDTKATLTGTGTKELVVGNNPITVTVTSESNIPKNYTIVINRESAGGNNPVLSDDNTLKSLKVDGVSVDNFNPNTTSYSMTVPNSKSSVEISAELNDTKASLSGIGTKTLVVGNNPITVTVTSESNIPKEYTINITRQSDGGNSNLSNNNNLVDITLDGVSISNFSSNVTTYSKTYGSSKSSVEVDAVTDDPKATVNGTGTKTLVVGNNPIVLTVLSESGISKTYTINITREQIPTEASDVNTLNSISIDGAIINKFNPSTRTYSYTTSSNRITISAEKTDPKSVVSGVGTYSLQNGLNPLKIRVTSESGIVNVYNINVTKEEIKTTGSSVNTLKTLSLDKGSIIFNSNTLNYSLEVDSDVDKVKVSSTLIDPKSSYVNGYGNREVNLGYGNNIIQIKVKAENGEIRTYKITVNRKDNRSSVNTLKTLTITGETINFKPEVLEYELETEQDELEIKSTLTDSKSTYVDNYGNRMVKLEEGANTILIKVKAENGKEKVYSILVTKKINNDELLITSLKISNYNLEFQSKTFDYSLAIKKESKLNITVKLSRKDAKYEILGNDNLENGSIITIKISLNDESDSKEYKINIIKDEVIEEDTNTIVPEPVKEKESLPIVPIAILGVGVISVIGAVAIKKKKS